MNSSIRNIQLVAVIIVLISTIIAFFLEMKEMYDNKDITLADLLLMFIYIEVIGLVRSYWETQSCLLYTSPSPRDLSTSRMPSSA